MMKKEVFFNGKKGFEHEYLMFLTEFLIPIIICLILLNWTNTYATSRSLDKNYLARDNALLASAVYASPGNIFYKNYFGDYLLSLKDNKMSIKSNDEDRFPITHDYIINQNLESDIDINPIKTYLTLFKSGNIFKDTLGNNDEIAQNLKKLNCVLIRAGRIGSIKINPLEQIFSGDDINLKVAETVEANLRNKITDTEVIKTFGAEDFERLKNADAVAGIRIGLSDKERISIYYSIKSTRSMESQKLGCLVANELVGTLGLSAALVQINPDDFKDMSQEKILDSDKIGIIIELGNSNNVKKIEENKAAIAQSIANGIKKYG